MAGLSIEEWIAKETAPRIAKLWGEGVEFSPVICDKIIGDGLQLIYLGTISQRPYYWLIRIDSKTDIESDDFNFEDILQPLEKCFRQGEDFINEEEPLDGGIYEGENALEALNFFLEDLI